jgi:hypothetical protein
MQGQAHNAHLPHRVIIGRGLRRSVRFRGFRDLKIIARNYSERAILVVHQKPPVIVSRNHLQVLACLNRKLVPLLPLIVVERDSKSVQRGWPTVPAFTRRRATGKHCMSSSVIAYRKLRKQQHQLATMQTRSRCRRWITLALHLASQTPPLLFLLMSASPLRSEREGKECDGLGA